MELARQQELFALIKNELEEMDMESMYIDGAGGIQVGNTLRVAIPMTEEGIPVITDIIAASLGEDADIVQFYTTMTAELPAGRAELDAAMPSLNFYCPIGSFGIFDGKQIYHKYSSIMEVDATAEQLCAKILDDLTVVYDILDAHYPILMALATGQITFAEAVESGELGEV